MKHILQTGQSCCYDGKGRKIACLGSGQDGEYRGGKVGRKRWRGSRF